MLLWGNRGTRYTVRRTTWQKKLHSTVASSAVRLRRHGVTLNFDLLTQKRNQVICVPRCTSDKSLATLAKIRQQILEISRKQNYHVNHGRTDGRTHGQRHGRTTRKHIAYAGAYRRRRLKKSRRRRALKPLELRSGKNARRRVLWHTTMPVNLV